MYVRSRRFFFCLMVGCFLYLNLQSSVQGGKTRKYNVKVSKKDEIKCRLSKRFVSVGLDSNLLERKWYGVHFGSQRLKNILTGLQPAYLRVGGDAANNLMYSPEVQGVQQNTMSPYLVQETFPTTLPPAIANGETTTLAPQTLPTTQIFNANQMQQTPTTVPTVAPQIATTITTPSQDQYALTTTPQPFTQAKPAPTEQTTAAYPTEQPNVQTGQTQQQQQQQTNQQEQQETNQQQQEQDQNNNNEFNQAPMGQQQLPNTPPTSGVQGAGTPQSSRQGKKLKSGKSKTKKVGKSKEKKKKQRHSRQVQLDQTEMETYDESKYEGEDSSGEEETQDRRDGSTVNQFSSQMFDKLILFAQEAGIRVIFALNEFTRDQDGSLNTNNANQLIEYATQQGYIVDWELGNEPDKYGESDNNKKLTPEQVGQDFAKLRAIIDSVTKGKSKLYGPDVSGEPDSLAFLHGFLKEGHAAVNAITWHHYYKPNENVDLADYVNPDLLESFRKHAQSMYKVVKTTKTPLWVGESGDFSEGGVAELSNSYTAGFMYLDKLGLAALYCNEVVIKNGLIGGNDAMLGKDFVPNPNYWVAFTHKQLVGNRVLNLGGSDKLVRLYAHCAKRQDRSLPKGSVVIYGVNLQPKQTASLSFSGYKGKTVLEYLLTAPNGNLKSQSVNINGQTMKLGENDSLPQLIAQERKSEALLPPLSYGFFVLKDAKHPLC